IFLFFQAEDGIRDATVTGVQTCALPISEWWRADCATRAPRSPAVRRSAAGSRAVSVGGGTSLRLPGPARRLASAQAAWIHGPSRSEERRVGEQRGWPGGAQPSRE